MKPWAGLCVEHCETSDEPLRFPIGAAIQRYWPDVEAALNSLPRAPKR
jgi:hypothetical protein